MHIFKKIIYILLLYNTFWFEIINGMESEENSIKETKSFTETAAEKSSDIYNVNVYSHGLGEIADSSKGPVYDYNGQVIKNSSFYTIENINRLIEYIRKNNKPSIKQINLEGMSMGAGVILTALAQLCYAADNTSHVIKNITQKEAKEILGKINQGSVILDVPPLSMKDTQIMVFFSHTSSFLTISLFCFCSCKVAGPPHYRYGNTLFYVFMLLLFNNTLAGTYAYFYDKKCISYFISQSYNPNLITPLDAAKKIRRYIHCPVLIHISKNDELLHYTKNKIQDFFYGFLGNIQQRFPTILLLSGDGSHDQNNNDFEKTKNEFLQHQIHIHGFPMQSIQHELTNNSIIYDNTVCRPVDIAYKDPVFPLISSCINCVKAYVFNKVIKKKEISHA